MLGDHVFQAVWEKITSSDSEKKKSSDSSEEDPAKKKSSDPSEEDPAKKKKSSDPSEEDPAKKKKSSDSSGEDPAKKKSKARSGKKTGTGGAEATWQNTANTAQMLSAQQAAAVKTADPTPLKFWMLLMACALSAAVPLALLRRKMSA